MSHNRRRPNKKTKKGGGTTVADPPLLAPAGKTEALLSSPTASQASHGVNGEVPRAVEPEPANNVLCHITKVEELLDASQGCLELGLQPPIELVKATTEPIDAPLLDEKAQNVGPADSQVDSKPVLDLIDHKLNELIERSATLERERLEIEELRQHLQHAIESAELRMSQIKSESQSGMLEGSHGLLVSLRNENERLTSLLKHARSEYQTLLDFIENDDVKELTNSVRQEHLEREYELNQEIDRLHHQIRYLEDQLGSSLGTVSEPELKKQLATVRHELMDARHEVVDLRLQCNELTARLKQYQDPKVVSTDVLSWEDRKQAWLNQLEREEQEGSIEEEKALDVRRIVEETSALLVSRDEEIADLKRLLEEQAVARGEVAVGATAISQLVDADEFIAEERQRLKEMQIQWEQKQRQGEIEMSLERAKLARERLELQEKLRSIEAAYTHAPIQAGNVSEAKPKGRWWARLGLKDD